MASEIIIRRMTDSDAPILTAEEISQGWGAEGRLENVKAIFEEVFGS